MLMFGDAMSIFARSTCAPSGNSPARMRRNRSRLSSAGRSRYGLFRPGSVSVPAVLADLVGRQAVDVGLAVADQLLGVLVHLLEVVGGVEHPIVPVEPEPADVLLDRLDVLDVFLRRIGVVEAQVASAAELLGDAEVQADRLGVADVQVAVRLRRKPRVHTPAMSAGPQVLGDDLADEVELTALPRLGSDMRNLTDTRSTRERVANRWTMAQRGWPARLRARRLDPDRPSVAVPSGSPIRPTCFSTRGTVSIGSAAAVPAPS